MDVFTGECPVCGTLCEWDWRTQEKLEDFLLWFCKRMLLRRLEATPEGVDDDLRHRIRTCHTLEQLKVLTPDLEVAFKDD